VRYFALKVRSLAILMRYFALFSVILKIGISPDRYMKKTSPTAAKSRPAPYVGYLFDTLQTLDSQNVLTLFDFQQQSP